MVRRRRLPASLSSVISVSPAMHQPTLCRMNSRKTKIGALMRNVIELCSNGLPCRSRIR